MGRRPPQKKGHKDIHGIILLNKPKGLSSNQAMQRLKHLIKANKAGHTGNLDPMATGLLPCCFGDATKVADLMINADKTYQARCVLGSQTNTGDATGEVINTHPKTTATDAEVMAACASLTGVIDQIPPMYSALHHEGRRLYDLARQGITVERPARQVTIHRFDCLANTPDYLDFEIKVSKGTYIRTLLEDFAAQLDTLAHMSALHRIETGVFTSEGMHTLEEISEISDWEPLLLGMDQALVEYPALNLSAAQTLDLIHGKTTAISADDGVHTLYDPNADFLGMGEVMKGRLRVKKLFMKSYQQKKGIDH